MKHLWHAVLALCICASGAFAHSTKEKTVPANTARIAAVEVIEMHFDSPMRITAFVLTGPKGEVDVTRETGLDPVTVFAATPPADLPPGPYAVEWRGLAEDGHPMQGMFGFNIVE